MTQYAALDVSQEATAICLVDEHGAVRREAKVMTCPETIAQWLAKNATGLVRVGMETGPLAVWLWNQLHGKGLPVVCMDARHANAALKMRANKTDRNDAAGLAQIVRTGWFKQVRIKTRTSYEIRSLLAARDVLVRVRVKLENEIRGLLRTFGVLFGKAAGGFAHRAHEIIAGELDASPTMQIVVEKLMQARVAILDRIKVLDRQVLAIARTNATAIHVGTRRWRYHGLVCCLGIRRRRALQAVIKCRRVPRAHATALRVGRGQPERAHLEAREQADEKAPIRGSDHLADENDPVLAPEGVGPSARQSLRVQEGARCRRPQARRHTPRDVENEHDLPLERSCRIGMRS